jgi:formyltetrahydrofolate synthetase
MNRKDIPLVREFPKYSEIIWAWPGPVLGAKPAAEFIDIEEDGTIVGLF